LIGGLIYVCFPDNPPADIVDLEQAMAPRLAPYDIPNAKIAHQVDEIEEGNWKLKIESNGSAAPVGPAIPSIEIDWPAARLFAWRSNRLLIVILANLRLPIFQGCTADGRRAVLEWTATSLPPDRACTSSGAHRGGTVVSVRSRVSVHFQTFSTSLLWLPR